MSRVSMNDALGRYRKAQYLFAIVLAISISSSNSFEYFTEKPSFVDSCKIYEPGFTKCSTASIQKLIQEVGKGIPELKEMIGPLDPLTLDEIRFKQDNNEAATIQADLTNLSVTGFSKLIIKESKVSKKDFSWLTKIFLPKMRLEGKYKMNGKVLLLPLNGEGDMFIDIDNIDLVMRTKTTLIEKGGFTFYNVTDVRTTLEPKGIKTYFTNLFGENNKELERSTNESFNANWHEFFEALRPLITETVDRVLLKILHKVFIAIPANFFVEDIPTPQQLYGKAN